jgi:hypothetical protein
MDVTVPDSSEAANFGAEHSAIAAEPIPQQGDLGNWWKATLANGMQPALAAFLEKEPSPCAEAFAAKYHSFLERKFGTKLAYNARHPIECDWRKSRHFSPEVAADDFHPAVCAGP